MNDDVALPPEDIAALRVCSTIAHKKHDPIRDAERRHEKKLQKALQAQSHNDGNTLPKYTSIERTR